MRLRWVPVILLVTGMIIYSFTVTYAYAEERKDNLSEFINKFSQQQGKDRHMDKGKPDEWRLYYFFSFSMPAASITRTMEQAGKTDMTMVIRGMKDNSMKKTAGAIQKLGKAQVDINPLLFKKFGIKRVPAIVLAKGKCDNNSCAIVKPEDYFTVYGDVSIDYALETMAKEEPRITGQIEPILAKLKGGGFYSK